MSSFLTKSEKSQVYYGRNEEDAALLLRQSDILTVYLYKNHSYVHIAIIYSDDWFAC